MSKRYDVVAAIPYERNGEKKTQFVRCGAAFDGAKGISIKLDSIPCAGWDGWLRLYEPKPKEGAAAADDSVPF